jgi:hypothetical protein
MGEKQTKETGKNGAFSGSRGAEHCTRARLHGHFADLQRLPPYSSAQAVFTLEAERRVPGQRKRSDPQNHGPWLTADWAPPIFGQHFCASRRSSPEAGGRRRGKRGRPDAQNQGPSPIAVPSASTGNSMMAIAPMPHEEAPPGRSASEPGNASREERGYCSEVTTQIGRTASGEITVGQRPPANQRTQSGLWL